MSSSLAIIAREPDQPLTLNWSLEQVEISSPSDDEVLVEMHATGICHTDIALSRVPRGVLGIEYPKVAGHEGAGVALVVGKNVQSVEVGDPVLLSFYSCSTCTQCEASHPAYCDSFASKNYIGSQGSMKLSKDSTRVWSQFFGQSSLAQYSTVNKSSIVNAKDLIQDLNELKLFAPLGCGFQTGMGAINNIAQAGPNDSVMISGLGAVGMGALMTAKITKCKVIIAVDRVQTRLELARRLGATHTINTNDAEISRLDDAVRAIVPKGASVAIDTTGVPSIIEQSVQSTHARGKVIFIGIPPKNYTLNINLSEHMNKGRAILGCIEGDCDPRIAIPQMIQWYREGEFPLDQVVQYFDATDYPKALHGMNDGTVIKPILIWKR